jgi:AcrR family transcriptional regulator
MQPMADPVKRNSKHPSKHPTGSTPSGDARKERWRSHREARREEFVEAAMRALSAHGPELSMGAVAAEAGVTKPVLYRHFADKADLHVALGQRGTEMLFERLIPAINNEEAPVPRIRKSIDAFFSMIEEYPNLYRLLATTRYDEAGDSSDADFVTQDKEIIASAVAALLGDYMRAFKIDSGAAEPWAVGVVGMVQNVADWWLDRRTMSKDSVVEYMTQLVWMAIDGVARAHGVVIEPDRPLELNKIVQLHRVESADDEATAQ